MNLTQLKFHYRKSELSVSNADLWRCKIKPGQRTPDISFKSNRNLANVNLFDLLKKGRPLVFFCIFERSVIPEQIIKAEEETKKYAVDIFLIVSEQFNLMETTNILIDKHSDFRQKYCNEEVYTLLIRPDGYIGFFEAGITCQGLTKYCSKFLGRN